MVPTAFADRAVSANDNAIVLVESYTVGQIPEGVNISPDGARVVVVTMSGSNKAGQSPQGGSALLRTLDKPTK